MPCLTVSTAVEPWGPKTLKELDLLQPEPLLADVRLAGDDDNVGKPPHRPSGDDDGGMGVGVLEAKPKAKTKKPSLYKVLMLNDDYTPMEFVVHVLKQYFGKTDEQAVQIMLHVHQKGIGVCGLYTLEVAEAKVTQTIDFARQNNHPLQCEIEKDDD